MRLYGSIEKTEVQDDGTIIVSGFASSEDIDSQGEIVTAKAMKDALPDYMEFANIREMHQSKAAGVALDANVQDDGRTWIKAHIVDDQAIKKVQKKVYKGFSIGGRVTDRDGDDNSIITGIKLSEISLVDRPANPSAIFSIAKVDIGEEVDKADSEPKGQYGDVEYADVKNKKYPVDTEEHIRAAWSYIHQEKNHAGYTAEEVTAIEKKIVAAWKSKIDKKGPPSAKEMADKSIDLRKNMYQVGMLANILDSLDCLQSSAEWENECEGDNSTVPHQLELAVTNLASILRDMVTEETAEMTMANKTGDLNKIGARHNKGDKKMVQNIHDTTTSLGAVCPNKEIDTGGKSDNITDLTKIAEMETTLAKLAEDNTNLKKRVEELEALPKAGGPAIMAIAKEEDVVGKVDKIDDSTPHGAILKAFQNPKKMF